MVKVTDELKLKNGSILKNRLVMAPMTTNDGTKSEGMSLADLEFFKRTTQGFGAVIIGSHSVSTLGSGFDKGWNIYNELNHDRLRQFVDIIHENDSKAIVQLYHAGRMAEPRFIRNHQPVAPSEVPALRSFASFPRKLSNLEIEQIITDFVEGTKLAIQLGFDGVEIHGANTYLIQQFFSPHSNRRDDKWGGNLSKRMTFILELSKRLDDLVREQTNDDFIVGYRFSPEEYETPGIRLKDTIYLLQELDKLSYDYFHVSLSDYNKTSLEGTTILDELFKQDYDTPIIGCGNVNNYDDVSNVLSNSSLVSAAKATIIDPDWATKIIENRDDIIDKIPMSQLERWTLSPGLEKLIDSSQSMFLSPY